MRSGHVAAREQDSVPFRATKMRPSVLDRASSMSTVSTPSRRPFSHCSRFACPFTHCVPSEGLSTTKYAEDHRTVVSRYIRHEYANLTV